MARFENENGDVVEVESDAAIANYRAREGFTELDDEPKTRKTRKSADEG